MAKAIAGAAELAGAVGLGVAAAFDPALLASPWFDKVLAGLVLSGIGNVAGAIGDTIAGNRSMQITTRQPASPRTIVYGTQMVGGTLIFESFTGHQWNQVIVLAGHQIEAIDALFLDGRKVIFQNGGFGGDADHNDHIGPDGVTKYNFGGKVSCFYRLGDQNFGDYMAELHGNDASWGPAANGDVPSLTGCAYVYLKLTSSNSQFPSRPEVKFLVRGKNDIYDPRTEQRGFTNNAAIVLADVISGTEFGLGDSSINTEQLIAAANICDEQVPVAALNGETESRYCCDWAYDTSTSVADVIQTMLTGMAGRWSFIGGEHFIFPGAYTAPSTSMDISDITAAFDWKPNRSIRDLPNRISATHVSPEWPWSTAGNYYQNRQTVENTFDMRFTQTSVPDYAQDQLHGYPNDEWLTQDGGHQRPLNLNLPTVLSVTQAQRVMKINLMRQRKYQGSGTIELKLWNYKLQPCDTTQFTFTQLGWNNRVMEVSGTSLRVDRGGDNEIPTIRFSLSLQETGPDVYAWSTIEELTVYSAPASPTQTPWTPNPPTNLRLSSGPQTAIVGQDGSVIPVIQVEWDTPLDNAAVGIAIQYQLVGQENWYSAPTADISLNVGLISTIVAGRYYDVRIATVRANGALSDWVEQDNFLVPTLSSFLGVLGAQWPNGVNLPAPGADVTAQQPIALAGIGANLIGNGDFTLGMKDWATIQGSGVTYDSTPALFIPAGAGAASPAFATIPGQKYRITYAAWAGGADQQTWFRIFGAATYAPSIHNPGHSYSHDFLVASSIGRDFPPDTYTYDWQCPDGVYFCSLAIYSNGTVTVGVTRVSAQDYSGVNQWGADVTGSNTSNDTSHVSGVPSGTIASVVPNGYKLFINSGSRSYSIQAI